MSSFNSSTSFRDQELLFDDIPREWTDPNLFQEITVNIEEAYKKEEEFFNSLADIVKSTFLTLEDKIKLEKDNQDRIRERKNLLFSKIITAKQTLDELVLKKNTLKIQNSEMVSKDELSEMLQRVVVLEKEKEIRQDDMKMKAKVLIGQMSFYKEYLNIYIDIPSNNDYILYFRKCRAEDNNKPQEWIHFKTDDFKKFLVVGIGSRGKLGDEVLKNIKSSDKLLREIIIETRELCLNNL